MEKEELHYIANKAYAAKLLNRIAILESALKEIDDIPSKYFSPHFLDDKKSAWWKIHEIATKALWPT
jgi:hypothetical protein